MNDQQLAKASDAFYELFQSRHVILYIGCGAKDEEIRSCIARQRWSAVITSRRDAELATMLDSAVPERKVIQMTKRADVSANPLSFKKLPILRLFGVEGDAQDQPAASPVEAKLRHFAQLQQAQEMISLLPTLLDHVNPLIVIGANSKTDWSVLEHCGLTAQLNVHAGVGTVTIWDMPEVCDPAYEDAYATLKYVADTKRFGFYHESLASVIRIRDVEMEQAEEEAYGLEDQQLDFYFQGEKQVPVSRTEKLVFENVGTLLTYNTVNRIRPVREEELRLWFANFLENSSAEPQWYGYTNRAEFHVKRSFEDALYRLVWNMLDGKGVDNTPVNNRPIILSGHQGSSKSVTLAALAYRIYSAKVNPVIYITRDSYLSANTDMGIRELDAAMELLERKAVADTRILVIWDNSSYRAGVERAHRLMRTLINRGRRRFVLVCSSYSVFMNEGQQDGVASESGYRLARKEGGPEGFVPVQQNPQVIEHDGCYYVHAVRETDEQERNQFWNRAREHSGVHPVTIRKLRERLEADGTKEIFEYYYYLITVLRDHFEESLTHETRTVGAYVKGEIKRILGSIREEERNDRRLKPIYQAMLKAGIDPELLEMPQDAVEAEREAEQDAVIEKRLDTFNMCVALFSRFKLSVPYGLAYMILMGNEGAKALSAEGVKLLDLITTHIPWIHYGQDPNMPNEDFTFRFRNSLEADMYLRHHDVTGEQQIDQLCKIIELCGKDYRQTGCVNENVMVSLQLLIRLMGPNSNFAPFQQSGRLEEYNQIQRRIDRIIDQVDALMCEYGVPDPDASFATIIVTFTREFYGNLWEGDQRSEKPLEKYQNDPEHFSPEMYEMRIVKLAHAIEVAQESIHKLEDRLAGGAREKQHLFNQQYSLTVEIAQCHIRLEYLLDEYQELCAGIGVQPKQALLKNRLSYPTIQRQLKSIIAENPTNGYAYNALFRSFERMYASADLTDQEKLQCLSEIMQTVENCQTMSQDIINRGARNSDELSHHITNITTLCNEQPISLDVVIRHRQKNTDERQDQGTTAFLDLFDRMLADGNPAAITFVCHKELQIPERGRRQLNAEEMRACQNVYKFMREDDIYDCLCSNEYSLAMLIRVCWMCKNGTTLTSTPECQSTRLDLAAWREVLQLCERYAAMAHDRQMPLLMLLHALATLQVSVQETPRGKLPAELAYYEAQAILRSIPEGRFVSERMKAPFMLCNEDGEPYRYTGEVLSIQEREGHIWLTNVPRNLGGRTGIRFKQLNLGRRSEMPNVREWMTGLELAIGFMGFSVYNQQGREERRG